MKDGISDHPTRWIEVRGQLREVDDEIVPLVKALSKIADLHVSGSCQCDSEERAFVNFYFVSDKGPAEIAEFLARMAAHLHTANVFSFLEMHWWTGNAPGEDSPEPIEMCRVWCPPRFIGEVAEAIERFR
jgi:hypothetical protein